MPKSKSEMPDEPRSYASSPCSLHELDAKFWPVNPAGESDEPLPEKSNQDAQEQD